MAPSGTDVLVHGTRGEFPCCFGIPIEIGIQFLAIFDMMYSSSCLVGWVCVLGSDLFAVKHSDTVSKNLSLHFTPPDHIKKIILYNDRHTTSTTTKKPEFTLRSTTTPKSVYVLDENSQDIDIIAKDFSKIAHLTRDNHDNVRRKCGGLYIREFLFNYQLNVTRAVFDEIIYTAITAEAFYSLLASLLLMTVCCFIEHRGSKVFVMCIWYLEFCVMILDVWGIILSQSHRLCILEYAWSKPRFKGQTFLFYFLLWPLVLYKPYELFVLALYIKDFLKDGYLKDETLPPKNQRRELDYQATYFKEFYAMEQRKAGHRMRDQETGNPLAQDYEDFDRVEVESTMDTMREADAKILREAEMRKRETQGTAAAAGGNYDPLKSIRRT